mgnify:CR=1 FL=1
MTDNEIIKALEDKIHRAEYPWVDSSYCDVEVSLVKNATDLLNRQQAEIERLNSCVKSEDEVRAIVKAQMTPMVKEIANEQIDLANKCGRISGILEFAEMLKDDMVPNIDDFYIESFVEEYIDNLVKEMVGEGK